MYSFKKNKKIKDFKTTFQKTVLECRLFKMIFQRTVLESLFLKKKIKN